MNAFEKMIDDVFKVTDFIEYFYTEDNIPITTIAYQMNTDQQYTEFGVDNGVSFYLTCKVSDFTPKKGKKIIFRNTTYRIESFYTDAFNLSYNIYLRSLTSK